MSEERIDKLDRAMDFLVNEHAKTEVALQLLSEAHAKTEASMLSLTKTTKDLIDGQQTLTSAVTTLALQMDADRQETRNSMDRMERSMDRMERNIDKLVNAVSTIHGRVSRLEDKV